MPDILFEISEKAKTAMQERGIQEDDIRSVLEYANESGVFLRAKDEDIKLAKKRIGNFTVYVKYTGNVPCEVIDTYSHRVMLAEDATA